MSLSPDFIPAVMTRRTAKEHLSTRKDWAMRHRAVLAVVVGGLSMLTGWKATPE